MFNLTTHAGIKYTALSDPCCSSFGLPRHFLTLVTGQTCRAHVIAVSVLGFTVKTAEIRQKKSQNQGVKSSTLSGVIAVSSVQLSQFESSTFFSAIVETLVKQEFPAL